MVVRRTRWCVGVARWCVGVGGRERSQSGDIAPFTALSNDVDIEVACARPLAAPGRPGDVVVTTSTSGSSPNVLAALAGAKAGRLAAVGLAGYRGGGMVGADLDALPIVRSDSVYRIQEARVCLYRVVAARSGSRRRQVCRGTPTGCIADIVDAEAARPRSQPHSCAGGYCRSAGRWVPGAAQGSAVGQAASSLRASSRVDHSTGWMP